jgi:hypothetical protein
VELHEELWKRELHDAKLDEKLVLLKDDDKELQDELLHGELSEGLHGMLLEQLNAGQLSDDM